MQSVALGLGRGQLAPQLRRLYLSQTPCLALCLQGPRFFVEGGCGVGKLCVVGERMVSMPTGCALCECPLFNGLRSDLPVVSVIAKSRQFLRFYSAHDSAAAGVYSLRNLCGRHGRRGGQLSGRAHWASILAPTSGQIRL